LVLVDVQLADLQLASVVLGNLVELLRDHLAGTTPLGPVVDQHGTLCLDHVLFVTAVADIADVVAHGLHPRSALNSAAIITRLWTDRKTQASESRTVRWRMKSIVSGYRCFVSRPSNAPVCSRIYRIASDDRRPGPGLQQLPHGAGPHQQRRGADPRAARREGSARGRHRRKKRAR